MCRPRVVLRLFLLGLLLVVGVHGQNFRVPGLAGRNPKPPPPPPPAATPAEPAVTTAVATSTTVIAGKCRSIWKKLKQVDLSQIHLGLNHHLDWTDLVWLGFLGWVTEPLSRLVYRFMHRPPKSAGQDQEDDNDTEEWSMAREKAYKQTWLYRISSTIGQVGRVVGLVYMTDISTLVLRKIGFQIPEGMNRRLANLIYALFGAQKVRQAKGWWLRKWFGKQHDAALTGRERVLEMVVDASIGFLLFFMIQDIFSLTVGRSLQSLFAIGGVSGIMISLASKDIAQLLLSGFVIRSSDKYIEGESIRLGDGTSGTITYLGAFEMHIRGGDGIVTRIPNTQIVNQRVQTLSRMTDSQVKQTLWFRYDDIEKIPKILGAIEEEIRQSCNAEEKLLSVRALWTEFKDDHLEVVVSANFSINPTSGEYSEMKQKVLFAIAQAVHKNHVEFAIPTSICKNQNIS